jgi:cytochrome bd ubiquinol oxidase subunit I
MERETGMATAGLMGRLGATFGSSFGVEGNSFFLDAVFTAVYLHGWDRLPRWAHFWTGIPLVIAGALGTLSVVSANSWMSQPGDLTRSHGKITAVNPWSVAGFLAAGTLADLHAAAPREFSRLINLGGSPRECGITGL